MITLKKGFAIPVAALLIISLSLHLLSFETNNPEEEDAQYRAHVKENYKVFSLATPQSLTFAGEEVPLDEFGIRERLDRELLVNTYWHSNTFLMFKRANRWFPVIEPILAEHNIPDDFKYLALVESGLTNAVSPAGATGFWQFMRETGKSYGLRINNQIDERYHVVKSTEAACKYLQDAYDRFGDWALVAASYNMGMGGINKQMNNQKVSDYWDLLLNEETGRYVFRILAVKEILNNSSNYGFVVRPKDLYEPYQTKAVVVDSTIDDLAQWAVDQGLNYKILKTLNPWMRQQYLKVNHGEQYDVLIPA